MKVNPISLIFEDLSSEDIWTLRELEDGISKGTVNFDHPFIDEWMHIFFPAEDDRRQRLMVGSTILHIRILQSIERYMWEKFGDGV